MHMPSWRDTLAQTAFFKTSAEESEFGTLCVAGRPGLFGALQHRDRPECQ